MLLIALVLSQKPGATRWLGSAGTILSLNSDIVLDKVSPGVLDTRSAVSNVLFVEDYGLQEVSLALYEEKGYWHPLFVGGGWS